MITAPSNKGCCRRIAFDQFRRLVPIAIDHHRHPVFNSEDAASDFLEGRMGGAFHIMSLAKSDIPNLIQHQGVMSSELGPKGKLRAIVRQVDNLVNGGFKHEVQL